MNNRLLDDERVVIQQADIDRYKDNGYNEDLLPLPDKKRNWTKFNFFTLWMGSVYNVPSYLSVGAFLFMGLSPINVGVALIISAFFIATIMVLNGKAGSKYGVPSTIVMKSSYGERGALFPGFLRGIIAAIMWYGLQNFTGSQALLILMSKLIPGFQNLAPGFNFFGIGLPGLICFILFSLINMGIGLGGGNAIKKFTAILNPLIYIVFGGMTIWAISTVGGISPILNFKAQVTGDTFSPIIVYLFIISSTLSVWGAPAVSASDFSKNAKSFKAQFSGQTLSFFVAYILFACSSVCILIGASIKYDTQMWNVLDIINGWDSTIAIIFSSVVLLMTTISTNATGNIVPAAYQLSAIFPKKVNYKAGVIIASAISFVIMPWKLMENQDSITLFLNIIGAVVGPVSGIMIAHYFTVAKQKLNIDDLYAKPGEYHLYKNGLNPKAFIATFAGALIPVISIFVPSLKLLSGLAWIIGFVVAFVTYFLLTRHHKPSTSSHT